MDFEAEPGKPLMLKDFLQDDSHSSSGFLSCPRRCNTTVRNLIEVDLKDSTAPKSSSKLLRSRSKAASATITKFRKASEAVIKAVKHLPFSPVRSQTSDRPKQRLLPRSLSHRLKRSFRSKSQKCDSQIIATVRVRDIMRWKSFSEVETTTKSVDFSSSIQTSSTNSSNSSWTDSDFSLQFSSSSSEYTGENGVECKTLLQEKKRGVGEDSMGTATCYRKPKVRESPIRADNTYEEKEQLSPVSVLDFPDEDEEMPLSSFQRSLANMDRTKQQLLQKIRRFESLAELEPIALFPLDCSSSVEENSEASERSSEDEVAEEDYRAIELLEHVNSSFGGSQKQKTEKLFLDFFREGLRNGGDDSEEALLRTASDWLNGFDRGVRREVQNDREALVREMEKSGTWMKFKEEEEDLALEMEVGILDELLVDLLCL
ncbi:uncharacterized protein [Aristolochia californica]|uniref:uncharacterized protein n=1 Tax=Aristolochia californica TaxID=171875 RepID=UPI0035DB2613